MIRFDNPFFPILHYTVDREEKFPPVDGFYKKMSGRFVWHFLHRRVGLHSNYNERKIFCYRVYLPHFSLLGEGKPGLAYIAHNNPIIKYYTPGLSI